MEKPEPSHQKIKFQPRYFWFLKTKYGRYDKGTVLVFMLSMLSIRESIGTLEFRLFQIMLVFGPVLVLMVGAEVIIIWVGFMLCRALFGLISDYLNVVEQGLFLPSYPRRHWKTGSILYFRIIAVL